MGVARTVAVLLLLAAGLHAQCVMCFRTAEAQNEERARVFNQGIVVMGVPPIALFFGILYWARRRTRNT